MLCNRERVRIVIPARKTRPVDPKIASRYASACSVAVRDVVPIFPHWKDYKERGDIFSAYASHVSGRFVLNLKDPWVHGSLIMNLKNRTRQRRHFLKSNFFDAVQDKSMVVRTPPREVGHMSEADWCKLIDNWSTPQKQVVSFFTQPCHQFYNLDCC